MSYKPQNKWCVAIIGMNATGKSSFGKRLAAKLQLKRCDIDVLFKEQYGEIKSFIEREGQAAYRAHEEELIREALAPGSLIVLSGGAIESEGVRSALKEHAAVIWIRANKKRVLRNIGNAKKERHEFAGNEAKQTAKELLEKRNPLYEEVANIVIGQKVRYSHYLPYCIEGLQKFYS